MGHTFAEKVIAKKIGRDVEAGQTIVVDVDVAMATDTTSPLAIKAFQEMGGKLVKKPTKTFFIIDHATPCPNRNIANLHSFIRDFAKKQGVILYDHNEGICHQIMIEKNHVKEGDIVTGADSHTCSYGAVGAFAIGVGSTDLAAVLLTGKTWLRVPESIKIEVHGELDKYVTAKDVVLYIIGQLTIDGATYNSVEYTGSTFSKFSLDERFTVCNMTVEIGAKNGVMLQTVKDQELQPDGNAVYKKILKFNASDIEPVIACPHSVDNVIRVHEKKGQKIDQVYIGSCTNGRLSDIGVVSDILQGKKVAPWVRLIVSPASKQVYLEAINKGYIQKLINAGALIIPPGCGPCVGTLGGIPGDNEVVISTTNRNFLGRMGNNKAFIYLASPLTAAASALTGFITHPEEVI